MVSEKKRKSLDAYNATCDYISIRPKKEVGQQIRGAAKTAGQSLQGYILQVLEKQIAAEKAGGALIYLNADQIKANAANAGKDPALWAKDHERPKTE